MIKKLIELLKLISAKIAGFLNCGVDKVYHYAVLIGIMLINILAYQLPMIWLLAVVGVEIAVTKEYADSKNPANIFSWRDIFAGVLGILTVVGGYYLYILIF